VLGDWLGIRFKNKRCSDVHRFVTPWYFLASTAYLCRYRAREVAVSECICIILSMKKEELFVRQ
jgi:hypothetical protein